LGCLSSFIGLTRIVVSSEGGDLDYLATCSDMDDLEAPANDPRVPKALLDLFRFGVSGNVKIFGLLAQQ
jgi:hypothetical protein